MVKLLRCDETVMEICESLQKGGNFLEILAKIYVKFEQFSSKILSRSWLNLWGNFWKNLYKFQENFREWILQKF